eukprot:215063-Rhodomonas_salina.1
MGRAGSKSPEDGYKSGGSEEGQGRLEPAFVGKGVGLAVEGSGPQRRNQSAELERLAAIEAASSLKAPRSRSAEPGVGAARHEGRHEGAGASSPPVDAPMPPSPRTLPSQASMDQAGGGEPEGRWG